MGVTCEFSTDMVLCLVQVRLGREMLMAELGGQPCSLVVSVRHCPGQWLTLGLLPSTA